VRRSVKICLLTPNLLLICYWQLSLRIDDPAHKHLTDAAWPDGEHIHISGLLFKRNNASREYFARISMLAVLLLCANTTGPKRKLSVLFLFSVLERHFANSTFTKSGLFSMRLWRVSSEGKKGGYIHKHTAITKQKTPTPMKIALLDCFICGKFQISDQKTSSKSSAASLICKRPNRRFPKLINHSIVGVFP